MILSKYMKKLMRSSYSQALRVEILAAAVATYRRREKTNDLGIRPFHRATGHDEVNRRRMKMIEKTSWYRPDKLSWKTRLAQEERRLGHSVNTKPLPPSWVWG